MSNVILWFRRDLRLADNPALQYAVEQGHHILPLFIWEPKVDSDWMPGAASRWWLHHSLVHLQHQLRRLGADLIIQSGDPTQILAQLGKQYAIDEILWNRLYEPHQVVRDGNSKTTLIDTGMNSKLARGLWDRLLAGPRPARSVPAPSRPWPRPCPTRPCAG